MRSKRMQPIARHAEQVQQQAVQVYVTAQQAVVDAQLQLEQLLEYRIEYSSRRTSNGMNIQQLRDYQHFLSKLNLSIEQAHQQIEFKKSSCEKQRQAWLKTRARSKALDSVIEKYKQQERIIAARIEQKEQDEYASRISTRQQQAKNES